MDFIDNNNQTFTGISVKEILKKKDAILKIAENNHVKEIKLIEPRNLESNDDEYDMIRFYADMEMGYGMYIGNLFCDLNDLFKGKVRMVSVANTMNNIHTKLISLQD